MRAFWLLLAGCGAAHPVLPDPSQPPEVVEDPAAIRVRTWNLEQFPRHDGHAAALSDVLSAHPADIIGVQEVDEADAFWAWVDDLEGYEGLLAESGYYTGVGMLYRPEAVRLVRTRSQFTDDSWAFPRPVLDATFDLGRGDLRVAVVHLKARLDEESQTRRRSAIEKLHAWAGTIEEPLAIVGDYNDELTDPEPYNVFGPFMTDAGYSSPTLPLEESGAFSYITFEAMIDHAVVTRSVIETFGEPTAEVLPLEQTWAGYDDVSDHRPVDVRF